MRADAFCFHFIHWFLFCCPQALHFCTENHEGLKELWRLKWKKKKKKAVIETFRRVLPNVFNGELNDVIKINQKAKYYMSEWLLYCCSIILPLIILQFYCRSAAELAHTILFFFITELWLQSQRSDFYPTLGIGPSSSNYWCFLLDETVRLKGFFFSFFFPVEV